VEKLDDASSEAQSKTTKVPKIEEEAEYSYEETDSVTKHVQETKSRGDQKQYAATIESKSVEEYEYEYEEV